MKVQSAFLIIAEHQRLRISKSITTDVNYRRYVGRSHIR